MTSTINTALNKIIAAAFTATAIAVATAIAWVVNELIQHGSLDKVADAMIRDTAALIGNVLVLDGTAALFVAPLAVFTLIGLGALFIARARA